MPSPFSCGPVICECSRMETQIEKKYWNWQVFDLIHASGIWMRPKGSVSKFTCTNTVASLRALVKSHEVFVPSCFRKTLIWKVLQKIHPKGTIIEILSSVTSQPTTSLKKNCTTVIFLWLLKRFFWILFCVRALV